jgi:hypothetical protein
MVFYHKILILQKSLFNISVSLSSGIYMLLKF